MNKIVHADSIREFLIAKTQGMWTTGPRFIGAADRKFWVPRISDITDILNEIPIGKQGNQGEIFDCDEYACTFKSRLGFHALKDRTKSITQGNPIAGGVFWGRASWSKDQNHAANWFVTRNNKIVWIEPQFNNSPSKNREQHPIQKNGKVSHLQLMLY